MCSSDLGRRVWVRVRVWFRVRVRVRLRVRVLGGVRVGRRVWVRVNSISFTFSVLTYDHICAVKVWI